MTALTRGPLPARVYWTRRVMVLGTVFLLVFGIGRLVTGGSDASTSEPQAVQAAATPAPSPTDTVAVPATEERGADRGDGKRKQKKRSEPVLLPPDGPCDDEDVAVTPSVDGAVGGRTVTVVLELRTISAAACTWRVSPEALSVKITSGDDDIWSSRQCPSAVPTRDLVLRSAVGTQVGVRWSGRRSDNDCTRYTEWARPGWYHVAAAALAGEPSDVQFELEAPERQVITQTVPADPEDEGRGDSSDEDRAGDRDRDRDRDEDKPKHR
jgi:hypothetical protein